MLVDAAIVIGAAVIWWAGWWAGIHWHCDSKEHYCGRPTGCRDCGDTGYADERTPHGMVRVRCTHGQ